MPTWFHHFSHFIYQVFVRWYTFLGTSPGGVAAQVITLLLTEVKGGWWRPTTWRTNWQGGLKRAALALASVWIVVFAACIVTTVYDDHMELVASNIKRVQNAKTVSLQYESQIKSLNEQNADLQVKLGRKAKTVTVEKPIRVVTQGPGQTEEEKKQRLQTRTTLGNLLQEAQAIKMACLNPPNPQFQCVDAANQWANKTLRYLSQNLEPSYVPRFNAATGLSLSYTAAKTPEIDSAVNYLTFKSAILEQFIKEFQ